MIKNIVRLTFVSYIWKRYKRLIVSTLVLFAYYWLVGKLHGDYIVYSELTAKDLADEATSADQTPLAYSFIIKWVALILGGIVYCISNDFLITLNRFKAENASESQGRSKQDPSVKTTYSSNQNNSKQTHDGPTNPQGGDPFEYIRTKDTLRSKADIIIEKKSKNE